MWKNVSEKGYKLDKYLSSNILEQQIKNTTQILMRYLILFPLIVKKVHDFNHAPL